MKKPAGREEVPNWRGFSVPTDYWCKAANNDSDGHPGTGGNSGTMIVDATCAPTNIRYSQDVFQWLPGTICFKSIPMRTPA